MNPNIENEDSFFSISIVSKITGLHAQTLRYYERAGMVEPSRSQGNVRLYSLADIERIKQMKNLIDELGVNLAGVEVIFKLIGQINDLQRKIEELEEEIMVLKNLNRFETE
ncbi:MAG: MerR family transcriptional regulator [Dehalococcoidia bacterium]|nr:MerR family transcriptional regulator [Dehalococcoidia bacterium]